MTVGLSYNLGREIQSIPPLNTNPSHSLSLSNLAFSAILVSATCQFMYIEVAPFLSRSSIFAFSCLVCRMRKRLFLLRSSCLCLISHLSLRNWECVSEEGGGKERHRRFSNIRLEFKGKADRRNNMYYSSTRKHVSLQ